VPDIYLPVILSNGKIFSSDLGAQIEGDLAGREQWLVPKRIIQWEVKWDRVEHQRGTYAWPEAYDTTHALLGGLETIIGIKVCPPWARLWLHAGSPPNPEFFPDLIRFIQAVQGRYHPNAIEFFNEPDVRYSPDDPFGEFYGAWVGPTETWHQGGARYGTAVATVYPNLGSKLLAGALMMHEHSLEFLSGAAEAGMKADAISYHTYVGDPSSFSKPMEHADEIRGLLGNVPLVLSETSAVDIEDSPTLRQWQADYLTSLISWKGVLAKIWYTLANNGWMNSDLVYNEPKPAYFIWKGG